MGILISRASRCRYGSNSRLRGISSEANGSSNSSNSGAVSNARPIATRCFLRRTGSRQAIKQRFNSQQRHQLIKLTGHAFRHAVAQIAAYFVMGNRRASGKHNRCGAFPALNRYRFPRHATPGHSARCVLLRASQTADGINQRGFPAPETPKIAVIPLAGSVSLRVKQCVPSVWEKLSSSMVSAPSVHG